MRLADGRITEIVGMQRFCMSMCCSLLHFMSGSRFISLARPKVPVHASIEFTLTSIYLCSWTTIVLHTWKSGVRTFQFIGPLGSAGPREGTRISPISLCKHGHSNMLTLLIGSKYIIGFFCMIVTCIKTQCRAFSFLRRPFGSCMTISSERGRWLLPLVLRISSAGL